MPFYDGQFNSLRICSNGWISFTSTSTTYSNTTIPGSGEPNNLVAPFWDDLNPSQGGTIYFYTNNLDSAIVQYDAVPHYSGSGTGVYTFEVILTADGNITYQYLSMEGTLNSATIGIEDADGAIGLQVVYNQEYVTDNLAVQFRLPIFWLSVDPTSGYALEGETNDITVTFDTDELEEGDYLGQIVIHTNDQNNPMLVVPCSLTVSSVVGIDDQTSSIPTAFSLSQNYPNPFNPTTDINFALPIRSDVNVTVFDLLGRRVQTLVSGEMEAGYHTVTWNGRDDSGTPVSSGIYFYRIDAGNFNMTRKMIMLK